MSAGDRDTEQPMSAELTGEERGEIIHAIREGDDAGLLIYVESIVAARVRRALEDAADAIQALHPGEVKASVTFLRARAAAADPTDGTPR